VGEIVGPIVEKVTPEHQPLLIALAERIAARRYRAWAEVVSNPADRSRLEACAEREEDIAQSVEALSEDASNVQSELLARHAGLEATYCQLFADRPLIDQFTMQAQGERLGAATWRAFAEQTGEGRARSTFLECAKLEEESALVLEELVKSGHDPAGTPGG
jgi:hypothetical protein